MYCPKCGAELSNGSKFCGKCGEKIILNTNPVSHSKRGKPWKALLVIVPVIILLVVIFIKRTDSSSSPLEDSYVSLNSGNYNLVSDYDEENPVFLSDFQSYPEMTNYKARLFTFSDDGNYLYFFSEINSENYSGTLCRIATDKLSEDSTENIKNCEIIDSDVVIYYYQCMEDNTVVYQTTDDTLYYYDNNRTTMLASRVGNYNIDYKGHIFYYVENDVYDIYQNPTYNLYITDLNDLQNPILLSTNLPDCYSVSAYYGGDSFLYLEYYSSGSKSLFRYNSDGEIEKIADDVAKLQANFPYDKVYFLAYNGRVYNLYQKNVVEHDSSYQPLEYLDEEMVPLYNLCSYSCMDEQLTVLDEDVIGLNDGYTGAISYYTLEQAVELNLTDVTTSEELYGSLQSDDSYSYNLFLMETDTVCNLPEDMKTIFKDTYCNAVFFGESAVMMDSADLHGSLYIAPFENGTVGSFSLITDDCISWQQISDTVYYMKLKGYSDYFQVVDLYSWKNGITTLLAEDILNNLIHFYDDGTISAYTKYTEDLGYELAVFSPEGEKTILGDYVTVYDRGQNSDFLYLSGNELYLYDGRKSILLETGTDYFWYLNPMEDSST